MAHKVIWLDRGKEPQEAPNPAYPEGIDLDASDGATATCKVKFPYPARRIGFYVIDCDVCGLKTMCTTA